MAEPEAANLASGRNPRPIQVDFIPQTGWQLHLQRAFEESEKLSPDDPNAIASRPVDRSMTATYTHCADQNAATSFLLLTPHLEQAACHVAKT